MASEASLEMNIQRRGLMLRCTVMFSNSTPGSAVLQQHLVLDLVVGKKRIFLRRLSSKLHRADVVAPDIWSCHFYSKIEKGYLSHTLQREECR